MEQPQPQHLYTHTQFLIGKFNNLDTGTTACCTLEGTEEQLYFSVPKLLINLSSYPHGLQALRLLVQGAVDVVEVEQRILGNFSQQVSGKVTDVIFTEIPFPQDMPWHYNKRVFMATLTEIPAQVLAVTQPLNVIYNTHTHQRL